MIFRYLALNYLRYFFLVAGLLASLVFILSYIRLTALYGDLASFTQLILISVTGIPEIIHGFMPIITALAMITTLFLFNRSGELLVLRSQGRSGLSLLMPLLSVVYLIGLVNITLLNPLTILSADFTEDIKLKIKSGFYLSDRDRELRLSPAFFQQGDGTDRYFVEAEADRDKPDTFYNLSLFRIDDHYQVQSWYRAKEASLKKNQLTLEGIVWTDGEKNQNSESLSLPALLPREQASNFSGIAPTPSFWALVHLFFYADRMRSVDLIGLHEFLSAPFFLIGIALIIVDFMFAPVRGRSSALMVSTSLLLIYSLILVKQSLFALGKASIIGPYSATWAPTIMIVALPLALVIRSEEH